MIPYGRQTITVEDIEAVVEALRSDWLTQGPRVEDFERALALYCGVPYCAVFANGTAALHAAYFAAGLGPGDEFIISPLTFVATANAGLWVGAKPVFVDVEPDTGNLSPSQIEAAINSRTKTIVPVDLAGHPAELDDLKTMARQNNLLMIEDACHSLGAQYRGQKIGAISDMTIFSFHPVKAITTGEGGAVTTFDKKFYERLIRFRQHGIVRDMEHKPGDWYYEMRALGLNYRLTDIQCALGLSQLKKLDAFIEARVKIAFYYHSQLSGVAEIELPAHKDYVRHAYHLFVIRLQGLLKEARAEVFRQLREAGIGAQVHYMPVYEHPYYREAGLAGSVCPVADDVYARSISLPIFPTLTQKEQDMVIKSLKRIVERYRERVAVA